MDLRNDEEKDFWPKKPVEAIAFVQNAADYLKDHNSEVRIEGRLGQTLDRDYDDQKGAQLLTILSDLAVAQMMLEAWFADIGTRGCSEGACSVPVTS